MFSHNLIILTNEKSFKKFSITTTMTLAGTKVVTHLHFNLLIICVLITKISFPGRRKMKLHQKDFFSQLLHSKRNPISIQTEANYYLSFTSKCSIRRNYSHTFLGRGVFKMDNDSVMQSTISSAASALLRQKTIASPISFFLGVNPRRISSNLSLCLNTNFLTYKYL